jgi:hypothetical protein
MPVRRRIKTDREGHQLPQQDEPVKGDVGNVVRRNDPGVLVGGDSPVLAHASRVSVADIASVNV